MIIKFMSSFTTAHDLSLCVSFQMISCRKYVKNRVFYRFLFVGSCRISILISWFQWVSDSFIEFSMRSVNVCVLYGAFLI